MWPTVAISIAAPVALFILILWILRRVFLRLSGWDHLHRLYASSLPATGWTDRAESATVGPIRFRRIVRVTAAAEGLYLSIGGLVPLPCIRIPWQDFVAARQTRFYRQTVVELTLSQPLPSLQISMDLYSRLRTRLALPPAV